MTKPSVHPGRVIAGLFIAPFIGILVGFGSYGQIQGADFYASNTPGLFSITSWVWGYTLPVSLVFGGLTHWALVRFKLWAVTIYAIVGMLLGPVALLAWSALMFGALWPFNAELLWLTVIVGGITALVFRLIVHRSAEETTFPTDETSTY